VPPRESRRRIGELLEMVGLTGREKERVEGFSRGMRQRLHIARGLLHDPEVLFLDEPTIGIDPVGARELRSTIATLREQGKTILLTTHYMFEADELCDRIAVMHGGRLAAIGTPTELKDQVGPGATLDDVFAELTGAGLEIGGRFGDIGRTRRTAKRLG
jgi:ABC-2 type transport system ATP-binding protein